MENDDWMHPKTSFSWSPPPPKNGTFFVIERKKATPVSGNVSSIHTWDEWQSFDKKDDRDTELKRLRETTTWHLRARTYTYVNGKLMGGHDPFEYRDD
jgi:hypothetical protein